MEVSEFINIFKEYPFCCEDRTKFKAVLLDIFPNKRAKINLMLQAYDEGIKSAIDDASVLDNLFIYRWISIIVDTYGSSKENAEWVVNYWIENYGKAMLNKPEEIPEPQTTCGSSTTNVMPDSFEKMPIRTMPIIFAVDTSLNTSGEIIGTLNNAIQSLIVDLIDAQDNVLIDLSIRVLSMSSNPKWIQDDFVKLSDFVWEDLSSKGAPGISDSLDMIAQQLEIIDSNNSLQSYPPAIVFVLASTPVDDYCDKLEKLKNISIFRKSVRVAITVGSNSDKQLLEQLTGNRELILEASNMPFLKKVLIRFHS